MIAATALLFSLLFQTPNYVQPGGVSGLLKTMDGVPAVNVRVVAIAVPRGRENPDDSLNYFDLPRASAGTLTDNEGKFTMLDLAPGRYYILGGAIPQGTYFPGHENIRGAEIVVVTSGEIVENLDFGMVHRLGGKLSGRIAADMSQLGPRTATITGGKLEDLLEVPVRPDGSFEFGHIPPGRYLLSLYPPTPGIASLPVTVADADITGEELVPLPTQTVTGRIIVRNGPIPRGMLAFVTPRSYVGASINPEGTFSVQLHSARHLIDVAGFPVGYTVASMRIGTQDAAEGLVVDKSDVKDVTIVLNAPRNLASLKGMVSGLASSRFSSVAVELAGGATYNKLQADIQQDGTFEFPAVMPGSYRLTLTQVPEMAPMTVILDAAVPFNVNVVVP